MTEKLYEQDSMLKSCLATVLSCAEDKRGYAVVLDRTAQHRCQATFQHRILFI